MGWNINIIIICCCVVSKLFWEWRSGMFWLCCFVFISMPNIVGSAWQLRRVFDIQTVLMRWGFKGFIGEKWFSLPFEIEWKGTCCFMVVFAYHLSRSSLTGGWMLLVSFRCCFYPSFSMFTIVSRYKIFHFVMAPTHHTWSQPTMSRIHLQP